MTSSLSDLPVTVFDSQDETNACQSLPNQTTLFLHEVNASDPRYRLFETPPYIPLLRGVMGGA